MGQEQPKSLRWESGVLAPPTPDPNKVPGPGVSTPGRAPEEAKTITGPTRWGDVDVGERKEVTHPKTYEEPPWYANYWRMMAARRFFRENVVKQAPRIVGATAAMALTRNPAVALTLLAPAGAAAGELAREPLEAGAEKIQKWFDPLRPADTTPPRSWAERLEATGEAALDQIKAAPLGFIPELYAAYRAAPGDTLGRIGTAFGSMLRRPYPPAPAIHRAGSSAAQDLEMRGRETLDVVAPQAKTATEFQEWATAPGRTEYAGMPRTGTAAELRAARREAVNQRAQGAAARLKQQPGAPYPARPVEVSTNPPVTRPGTPHETLMIDAAEMRKARLDAEGATVKKAYKDWDDTVNSLPDEEVDFIRGAGGKIEPKAVKGPVNYNNPSLPDESIASDVSEYMGAAQMDGITFPDRAQKFFEELADSKFIYKDIRAAEKDLSQLRRIRRSLYRTPNAEGMPSYSHITNLIDILEQRINGALTQASDNFPGLIPPTRVKAALDSAAAGRDAATRFHEMFDWKLAAKARGRAEASAGPEVLVRGGERLATKLEQQYGTEFMTATGRNYWEAAKKAAAESPNYAGRMLKWFPADKRARLERYYPGPEGQKFLDELYRTMRDLDLEVRAPVITPPPAAGTPATRILGRSQPWRKAGEAGKKFAKGDIEPASFMKIFTKTGDQSLDALRDLQAVHGDEGLRQVLHHGIAGSLEKENGYNFLANLGPEQTKMYEKALGTDWAVVKKFYDDFKMYAERVPENNRAQFVALVRTLLTTGARAMATGQWANRNTVLVGNAVLRYLAEPGRSRKILNFMGRRAQDLGTSVTRGRVVSPAVRTMLVGTPPQKPEPPPKEQEKK